MQRNIPSHETLSLEFISCYIYIYIYIWTLAESGSQHLQENCICSGLISLNFFHRRLIFFFYFIHLFISFLCFIFVLKIFVDFSIIICTSSEEATHWLGIFQQKTVTIDWLLGNRVGDELERQLTVRRDHKRITYGPATRCVAVRKRYRHKQV